jgi:hypothetical protein
MEYLARCHCGVLSATYRTALQTALWPVRACQCAFCRAHCALSTSDPDGLLIYSASDLSLLRRYRFGTRSADFMLCGACGVFLGAVMTQGLQRWGVLNLRALQPVPADLSAPQPMQYEAESIGNRTERRTARWTPIGADSI